MHGEVLEFVDEIKKRFPENFKDCRVLELGSQYINGTVRDSFENCDYIGVDSNYGPMVDVVCEVHDYNDGQTFDTVVTTELLEHDTFWKESILNGWKLLRDGGLFVGTCAGPDRAIHNANLGKGGYYKNISKEEIKEFASSNDIPLVVRYARGKRDLQFWARKVKGGSSVRE